MDYADATARVTVTVAPNVPTPADGGDAGADRDRPLSETGLSASAWLTPLLTGGLLITAGVLLLFRRRTRY